MRAFAVLRRSMRANQNGLDIEAVYHFPSGTQGHAHLIIVLRHEMDALERALWALWMGSDRVRGIYVIQRLHLMVDAADVFSTHMLFPFRPPDDRCECPEKHKDKRITDNCPAMKRLMLEHRSADYFPRNTDRKKRKAIRVPWGRVPKDLIERWR
jgi:hypothetical protein